MSRTFFSVSCTALAGLLLSTSVCLAADNPWNGTWKLNEARSKRTGTTDRIGHTPDGKWEVTTSGITFSFACDDKEYPIVAERTQICHMVNANEVDTIIKSKGQELAHVKRTLSDGGKTETVLETGTAPNGTPFSETEIYKKIGAGEGWTGTWRNTKVQESTNGVAIVEASGDTIKFTYPMEKSSLVAKLDGTPTQEQGPHPTGIDISMKAAGPKILHEVDSMGGKPIEHDTLTLSADGKVLTIEALRTGNAEKQVYVYDKQ